MIDAIHLQGLSAEETADVLALIHAFRSGTMTAGDFDAAMAAGGIDAVRDSLAEIASRATCPSWCKRGHPAERIVAGGFHHDSDSVALVLTPLSQSTDTTRSLHVKLAQFAPPAADGREYTVQVEVQDDNRTLLGLAANDAGGLAMLLLRARDAAEGKRTSLLDERRQ